MTTKTLREELISLISEGGIMNLGQSRLLADYLLECYTITPKSESVRMDDDLTDTRCGLCGKDFNHTKGHKCIDLPEIDSLDKMEGLILGSRVAWLEVKVSELTKAYGIIKQRLEE